MGFMGSCGLWGTSVASFNTVVLHYLFRVPIISLQTSSCFESHQICDLPCYGKVWVIVKFQFALLRLWFVFQIKADILQSFVYNFFPVKIVTENVIKYLYKVGKFNQSNLYVQKSSKSC